VYRDPIDDAVNAAGNVRRSNQTIDGGDNVMAKGRHRGEGRHLFGTDHNVQGKGDADRVSDLESYQRNLSEVRFTGVTGLVPAGKGKLRKVYKNLP
jgi:hypothetical protein